MRVTDDSPLRIDFGSVIHPDRIELLIPDPYSLQELCEGEAKFTAQVSADLITWVSIPFIHGEKNRIDLPKNTSLRYLRIPNFCYRISEVNAYEGDRALPRETWRASNLFGSFAKMKFTQAWTGKIRIEEPVKGAYLCVALNGKHGIEGAYAALRTHDGRYIGAIDRATSFPCNPFEGGSIKRDGNYTYYFPVTAEMLDQDLEVVVLAGAGAEKNMQAEVWHTAHAAPFEEHTMILK